VAKIIQFNTKIFTIRSQRFHLQTRQTLSLMGRCWSLVGTFMVSRRRRAGSIENFLFPVLPQTIKCLGAGNFMNEMPINKKAHRG